MNVQNQDSQKPLIIWKCQRKQTKLLYLSTTKKDNKDSNKSHKKEKNDGSNK